jgi:hypothetical protein
MRSSWQWVDGARFSYSDVTGRRPVNLVVMPQDTPMTPNDTDGIPRLRLSLLLWLAGMLGVVVITVTVLPQLLGEVTLPAPLW